MKIRVLLADDHEMIRDGLRGLFDQHPHLELVGESTNGHETLALAAELLPDVVVMDISMPGLDGPDAARQLLQRHPQMRVIALTMHTDRYFVDKMRAAGAHGYIPKEDAYDSLVAAIETVFAGGTHYP